MLTHIQILRFIAAFAVVAFHAWGVAPNYIRMPEHANPFGLTEFGHGVDLFFVISGFIIFYATHRAQPTSAAFLRQRIERVVPLYFAVTFAVTALALTWPEWFASDGWYTPRHILKSLAFIAFTDGDMPVVYVGWSLEFEMFFYLAAALMMAFTEKPWRNLVVLFALLPIAGALPGVAMALGNYAFFTDALLLEFTLGVVAGHLFVTRRLDGPMAFSVFLAVAMLLARDPTSRALLYGLPSAALVFGAAVLSRHRPDPSGPERALARLGDASYSIYLAQVQTVSFAARLMGAAFPSISPYALVLLVSGLVTLLGLALNIAVEKPLLRLCRNFANRRSSPAPALPGS